jgi:hypothetical protein
MFQSSASRLRAWLRWTEDILGDPLDDAQRSNDNFVSHPHRRALRWEHSRRAGTVPARPAYCISPVVRAPSGSARRDHASR